MKKVFIISPFLLVINIVILFFIFILLSQNVFGIDDIVTNTSKDDDITKNDIADTKITEDVDDVTVEEDAIDVITTKSCKDEEKKCTFKDTLKGTQKKINDTIQEQSASTTLKTKTTPTVQKDVQKRNIEIDSIKPMPKENLKIKQKILITKIQLDTSSSTHEEYVELYNLTDKKIDLDNYSLKKYSKSNDCTQKSTNLVSSSSFEGTIKPHDFFVITHQDFSDAPWADLTFSGKNYTIAKNSSIVLYDNDNNVVDTVGVGSVKCFEKKPAPTPNKNEALERKKEKGIFIDTNNNNADFFVNKCPFPGNFQPPNTFTNIRINEIYPNPCKKDDSYCSESAEFIELYNPNNVDVPLAKWKITDSSSIGGDINNIILKSLSFTKLTKKDFKFTLNNDEDFISLISPICSVVSSIRYEDSQKGRSLNYGKDWYWAEPTPEKQNSIDPRTITYPQLFLNEILPNPFDNENTDEFIEIYNPNSKKINLKNWTLKDASKSGSHTFLKDSYIKPYSFFVIHRTEFKFALNNNDETVSLIAPNEKTMSQISYKSAKENVSYNYNLDTKKWRWSKYLTPNKKNIFNNLPNITKFNINEIAYKDVYTEFAAKATDLDDDELKIRWDFGDGRKSYKWETRHKYTQTGIFKGSLRIQDGSEEVIKKFQVVIKKYPKYEIKITKILPNPSGKDAGNEFIIIKNNSKKKINLKNWSIATGTKEKTIVNHPIYKKLIIKPGKTIKITKKYAAISLPNKTGIIEIRRPNGSVSHKKGYGNKNTSIPENALYEKINNEWKWTIPQDLKKQAQTNAIIQQALKNETILSQQKLENIVAYNTIHNPKESILPTNRNQLFFIQNFLQKMNFLLTKLVASFNSKIYQFNRSTPLVYNSPIYPVSITQKPCNQPYLFAKSQFDFCK